MSLPSLTPRVVLAGCTGLLLLGGVVGAATVDASSKRTGLARAPDATTPAGDTTTSTGAAANPEPVAPVPLNPGISPTVTAGAPVSGFSAGTTTTAAARPGKSSTPGPLVAPKVGDHVYESTSTSASGTRTGRATTKVEAAGTEGSSTIQVVTLPLDLGDQQVVAANTVAWGAGAVVRRSVISLSALGPQQLDCLWQPVFSQYAGGLAVGTTWSFDSRCTGKIQGIDVAVRQRATRRVSGAAQVAGPAGAVATWTIADDTTIEVTSPLGVATVHLVGSQSLAPSLGLPVRTDARIDTTSPGSAPGRSTLTTKLVALP